MAEMDENTIYEETSYIQEEDEEIITEGEVQEIIEETVEDDFKSPELKKIRMELVIL